MDAICLTIATSPSHIVPPALSSICPWSEQQPQIFVHRWHPAPNGWAAVIETVLSDFKCIPGSLRHGVAGLSIIAHVHNTQLQRRFLVVSVCMCSDELDFFSWYCWNSSLFWWERKRMVCFLIVTAFPLVVFQGQWFHSPTWLSSLEKPPTLRKHYSFKWGVSQQTA